MSQYRRYMPVILLVSTLLVFSIMTIAIQAELSDKQAEEKFKALGCTSCHNGKTADEFDEMVEDMVEEWPEEYSSIDEAAQHVVYELEKGVKFNNFDELMAKMAKNVNRDPNDPDIVALKEFFKSKFEAGKSGEVKEASEMGEKGTNTTLILGIVAIIVIIVLAAVSFKIRR